MDQITFIGNNISTYLEELYNNKKIEKIIFKRRNTKKKKENDNNTKQNIINKNNNNAEKKEKDFEENETINENEKKKNVPLEGRLSKKEKIEKNENKIIINTSSKTLNNSDSEQENSQTDDENKDLKDKNEISEKNIKFEKLLITSKRKRDDTTNIENKEKKNGSNPNIDEKIKKSNTYYNIKSDANLERKVLKDFINRAFNLLNRYYINCSKDKKFGDLFCLSQERFLISPNKLSELFNKRVVEFFKKDKDSNSHDLIKHINFKNKIFKEKFKEILDKKLNVLFIEYLEEFDWDKITSISIGNSTNENNDEEYFINFKKAANYILQKYLNK